MQEITWVIFYMAKKNHLLHWSEGHSAPPPPGASRKMPQRRRAIWLVFLGGQTLVSGGNNWKISRKSWVALEMEV